MRDTNRSHISVKTVFASLPLLLLFQTCASAQVLDNNNITTASAGGIRIETDGLVRFRETDARDELARIKAHAATLKPGDKAEKLVYISLPKLLAEAKALSAEGKPLPEELRYLGGMTQLRYVFLFPDQKDLVLAGPAEPWDATNPWQPIGKKTGRPVMNLDDVVVALPMSAEARKGPFGCTIDPAPDSLRKSTEVMKRFGGQVKPGLKQAMADALGPQTVAVFGAAADTRLAFVCVAADYKLKRLSMGVDPSPVTGVGTAVDDSRAAGNRFWFEAMYEPLLVSRDGTAYEIRGQRLELKAGAESFDEKGATEKAKQFARNFTQKVPQLAATVPLFADLQNLADLSLLASLIRQDKLDSKSDLDLTWLKDEKSYHTTHFATPKTAETLVNLTNGSLVAGGVVLSPDAFLAESSRQ